MTTELNLNVYLTKGAKVFTGRDRGLQVRKQSNINQLVKTNDVLTIRIPDEVRSINPSFLEELLTDVVRMYGRDGFLQRVKFVNAPRYDVTQDLEEAIDRILTEDNALSV